ncbi:DNA-3-methyladenine glycosylase 2 family protein [Sphaerisporangium rubeum]|uniref:3-methyladenine DNA glycosylase/8-oxoguanine DNA glycosylase n=1 Tax=Sphaerisporangium rubeum TaxID=321317 RepID=A0A7X0IBA3_9ACTN|nr:3-methyladenine DNA glycosylase/8-oxoguanine DNA glycosylase [Sphaerisporangium rubeum]
MRERTWRPGGPVDVAGTLRPHRRGAGDPAWQQAADGAIWRTARTPDGPGTLRVSVRAGEGVVVGRSFGPGGEWMLETLPELLGGGDEAAAFHQLMDRLGSMRHPLVYELARRHGDLRVGRTSRVFEALVPAVLEQKVVGREARRAWRWLLTRYGEPAPGPGPEGMRVFPEPEVWRTIPSWDWHRAGVEGVRARTIINAAPHAGKFEAATSEEADRLMRSLPGIGVWTSAETRQRAHGDPDAVSVGDYHIPSLVGWSLTGARTDDAGMLGLLAPYRGHRHRVVRLLELGGTRPPARGPRMAARDYRSF